MNSSHLGLKILLIEDDPDDRMLIRRKLMNIKYELVIRACDSKDQFSLLLDRFNPDIILSDYILPNWSGLEAFLITQELRPDIPFIFISGAVDESLAKESVLNGAFGYVLKDHLDELEKVVYEAAASRDSQIHLSNFVQTVSQTNRVVPWLYEAYQLLFELHNSWQSGTDITDTRKRINKIVDKITNGDY